MMLELQNFDPSLTGAAYVTVACVIIYVIAFAVGLGKCIVLYLVTCK